MHATQGARVTLYESPDYAAGNFEGIDAKHPVLHVTGALSGEGQLAAITTDLESAVRDAEVIMVCTVVQAHEHVAMALAPLITPDHVVVLNPGSTGGALHLSTIWRRVCGITTTLPTLVEFGTLTYGCRAKGCNVSISVKVSSVSYGTLPAEAMPRVAPALERWFPGLSRAPSVLAAGLTNGN